MASRQSATGRQHKLARAQRDVDRQPQAASTITLMKRRTQSLLPPLLPPSLRSEMRHRPPAVCPAHRADRLVRRLSEQLIVGGLVQQRVQLGRVGQLHLQEKKK